MSVSDNSGLMQSHEEYDENDCCIIDKFLMEARIYNLEVEESV